MAGSAACTGQREEAPTLPGGRPGELEGGWRVSWGGRVLERPGLKQRGGQSKGKLLPWPSLQGVP